MIIELIPVLFAVFAAASRRMQSPFAFSLLVVPLVVGMDGIRSNPLLQGFLGQAGIAGPLPVNPEVLAVVAVIIILCISLEQTGYEQAGRDGGGWQ